MAQLEHIEAIEKRLSFSLQFSTISTEQKELLEDQPGLPANIHGYIQEFDAGLSDDEFANPHYAYRILFVPKTANRKGQADRVIEFVNSDSLLAEAVNKEYAVIKETEKKKYLPKQVVDLMKAEGYPRFSIHYLTRLWQSKMQRTLPMAMAPWWRGRSGIGMNAGLTWCESIAGTAGGNIHEV